MEPGKLLYICPTCFRVCETGRDCHDHETLECDPGEPGDFRRKPVSDRFGALVSRAPLWYLEARGTIPAYTRLEP